MKGGEMMSTQNTTKHLVQEDEIKCALSSFFPKSVWKVDIRCNNEHGVDFEAKKDDFCWKIEVKSEYEKRATTNSSFLQVWGEILKRIDNRDTCYGVAFPDTQIYRQLCSQIPSEAKKRIKVFILFVKTENKELKGIDLLSWDKEDKTIPVPAPFRNFGANEVNP